ncbi:hypothetical protein FXB40_41880 [Bradyrhizobium rifense]|uniref:Uncharacterized protein n=1 Tax=Bradyrhizobium rifense TaxID=515499 RepID=A0A5D3JYD4_9BRAD|nr:hypothetical protein FXB40_41880 [Bradyrhizobium rifense]
MDKTTLKKRFFIRMGGTGWRVYDRERRGHALPTCGWADKLTKDEAERIHLVLISSVRSKSPWSVRWAG